MILRRRHCSSRFHPCERCGCALREQAPVAAPAEEKKSEALTEAKFTYCQSLYEREFEIKERLEKKASVVFALPSTLAGALLLKTEPVKEFTLLVNSTTVLSEHWLLIGLFTCFLVAMLTAMAFSIATIVLQKYRKEYPKNLYEFLFNPKQKNGDGHTHFYHELSARMALATQYNANANELKSKRLSYAVLSLFVAALCLFLFITLFMLKGVL